METVVQVIQVLIALGIVNVWIVRFGKPTPFRCGNAKNMKEEFAAYGLPAWFMYVIGFLKLICALGLLVGLWYPSYTRPAAVGLSILMAGAVSMHYKARDPMEKWIPSIIMLLLSLFVAYFS